MIKPCDAAVSAAQTIATAVDRSPDLPSGDAWRDGHADSWAKCHHRPLCWAQWSCWRCG